MSNQLVKESVRQGWEMTELVFEKNSMEEVFEQLTKNINKN